MEVEKSLITKQAIDLIKKYESFMKQAYQLKGEAFYTIGYGTARVYPTTNKKICKEDIITEEQAEEEVLCFCKKNIEPTLKKMNNLLLSKQKQVLNEKQIKALCSRLYNSGCGKWFSTKCCKAILNNDQTEALKQWDFWKYVDISNQQGVKRRCNEEIELFYGISNYWK